MIGNRLNQLRYDPVSILLSTPEEILKYFVGRDILDEEIQPIYFIWDQPEVGKILKKQLDDGSFKYSGKRTVLYPEYHYELVQTWKQFRLLIDKYEMTKEHPSIKKSAEYLFSCQTKLGDFRGFIGNQYATYYTGVVLSLLIKAGYEDDPRVHKGLKWLISMRQNDGGWIIPLQTANINLNDTIQITSQFAEPIEPDKTQPFAHNCTGMVIRAFAVHKKYQRSEVAFKSTELLKSRFFQEDAYPSYKSAENWKRFQFPFWWNDLLSALDSISLIGISKDDEDIKNALAWLLKNQQENGLWKTSYSKIHKSPKNKKSENLQFWITLVICRIFKRFYA